MSLVSVIIPSRNDRYLARTIESVCSSTQHDIELIIVLDGPTDYPLFEHAVKTHRIVVISNSEPQGVRPAINQAVERSKGDYILKLDGHCIVGAGFAEILSQDCEDDWVVVARRFTLDIETMQRTPRIVDYYYLSCPWTHPKPMMMQSCPWITKTEANYDKPIDDLMCFQGSMWFTSRKHWDALGGLEINGLTYAEHHEISMKTWLMGGRVVINKKAWYAHPKVNVRGYHMSLSTVYRDHDVSARYWICNTWEGRKHNFDWLIDKFWPLPTEDKRHKTEKYFWPVDWRKYYHV
jgi:glycosyltransferase involved in cell wall biosynthesis